MSTISAVGAASYAPTYSSTASTAVAQPVLSQQDKVELSLAGRIALGVKDGQLTSDQGEQLYTQLKSDTQQLQSGTPGAGQLQSLSEQIYGDGHDGAAIPAGTTVSPADARSFEQAGRVVAQAYAGNLSGSQATQLFSQVGQIFQQAQQTGDSATTVNQEQNQLSADIYHAAHSFTTGPVSPGGPVPAIPAVA